MEGAYNRCVKCMGRPVPGGAATQEANPGYITQLQVPASETTLSRCLHKLGSSRSLCQSDGVTRRCSSGLQAAYSCCFQVPTSSWTLAPRTSSGGWGASGPTHQTDRWSRLLENAGGSDDFYLKVFTSRSSSCLSTLSRCKYSCEILLLMAFLCGRFTPAASYDYQESGPR